ncbi:MAG: FtsB family cell division protein [Myxococcales bacterium]
MPSRSFRKALFFGLTSAAILTATLFDPRGLRRYGRLRSEVSMLAKRNGELALENARLSREVTALQGDRRYQERAIREELGFVRPGQLLLELDASEPPASRDAALARRASP